ncbi:replication initiation protein [Azohydromonas caseinilytica]|uniref:Replication initiation protein n=1 Tax=Azohydromonas caseinilytica TaxID=2728836 RepID=A0A848FI74_9BURK|nr:replication initiation protein [Azohydromonas caseinilytica]NML18846.1 replication initiation protein [Azohydromonas caseinilytica]
MPSQPALFDEDDSPACAEVVRKHVNAVALMPRDRKITLLARRSFNVLLHVAQRQSGKDIYSAPLSEIINLSRFDSNNYELLKKTLKQLMGTVVEWQSPTSGEFDVWEASTLLAGCKLIKNRKSGAITIEWSYSPQIREQLMGPDRYARIALDVVTQLRSHAAMALYEICVRYIDNPSHLTARQHWRWWRPVLTGQQDDPAKKPPQYRYFKRDVLAPAIAEINALSDIEVRGPVEHKGADNKTIEQIQFAVVRKKTARSAASRPAVRERELEPVDLPLIGRAIDAGVKQDDAERLLQEFGPEALSAGLDSLHKRAALPPGVVDPVQNPGRYLRAVLPGVLKKAAPAEVPAPAPRPKPAVVVDAPRRQARWLDEWLRRAREALRQEILALPDAERAHWQRQFREHLAEKRSALLKRFDTSGWTHSLFIQDFIRFYGNGTRGLGWDKPSAEQLLELAAEVGDTTA